MYGGTGPSFTWSSLSACRLKISFLETSPSNSVHHVSVSMVSAHLDAAYVPRESTTAD